MPVFESYAAGTPSWVDLMTKDARAAAAWYGELFGWDVDQQGDPDRPYWMFRKDGHSVAGMGEMTPEMANSGMPCVWNTYFAVDDCDASVDAAVGLGASVVFPPMDAMEAGRMAYLADPEGAVFALWQAGKHCGASLANERDTWCWNELDAKDIQTSAGFYRSLLGWRSEADDGGIEMFYLGDHPIGHGMNIQPEWGDMPPVWMVYFRVGDTDETCRRVEAAGGKIHVPGMDIPAGRFALLEDPQGAMFYVIAFPDR